MVDIKRDIPFNDDLFYENKVYGIFTSLSVMTREKEKWCWHLDSLDILKIIEEKENILRDYAPLSSMMINLIRSFQTLFMRRTWRVIFKTRSQKNI